MAETEIRAGDLQKGDTYQEVGMEPVKIRKLSWHGDTVLVWGRILDDGETYKTETTLDRDTVVTLVNRKGPA